MHTRIIAAATAFSSLAVYALPEASQAERMAVAGEFNKRDPQGSPRRTRVHYLTCPRPGLPFSGYFIPRYPLSLILLWGDGSRMEITFRSSSQVIERPANSRLKPPLPKRTITSRHAFLAITGLPLKRLFVKPNIEVMDDELLRKMDLGAFPDATREMFHLRAECVKQGLSFYLNGSYAGTLRKPSRPVRFTIRLRESEEFIDLSKAEKVNHGFVCLDLDMRSRRELPVELSIAEPLPVPMRTDVNRGLDLRKVTASDSHDGYRSKDHTRSAFDALPTSFTFSVPAEQYTRAWVLCSAVPDRDHRPVFRLAMTRFAKYGRDRTSIPTCEVDLDTPAENARQCGTVTIAVNEEKESVPLYLVELTLDHGMIQDLIYTDPHAALPFRDYLDIDLQGPGKRRVNPKALAAVAVYGLTLERVPCTMRVGQAEAANAFHNEERPRIPVHLAARKAGNYELAWTIKDIAGKVVRDKAMPFGLLAGTDKQIEVPIKTGEKGWFSVDLALADDRRRFSTYKTAVALLHPDTRKAGYESPYSTWWFGGGSHQITADPEYVAPYLFKAGIRSSCNTDHAERDLRKWTLTLNQIPHVARNIYTDSRILSDDPQLWLKMEEELRFEVDKLVKRFPHCRQALVLHESYRGYPHLPSILLRKPPEMLTGEGARLEHARIKATEAICRFYRKYHPELKIVFGNSTWTPGLLESFAARGLDLALFDAIGIEAPGGHVFPPESFYAWNPNGNSYLAREVARLLSSNHPVTACYEWSCRPSRELGALKQAQWLMRDAMIAYSYSYDLIPISGTSDPATAYNNSGAYGTLCFCDRQFRPKPCYVAAAVLTRILDQATFVRAVPTDDCAVYACEFTRACGDRVYTLWVADGAAVCELEVATSSRYLASEDLFGRQTKYRVRDDRLTLTLTPSLRYLITEGTLASVRMLSRERDVRDEEPPALSSTRLSVQGVTADVGPNAHMANYPQCRWVKNNLVFSPEFAVPAAIAEVTDPERGECLAVDLDMSALPEDHWNHGGYAVLRLRRAVDIPSQAHGLGMWVKGNASQGRLVWEVTDANGNAFIANGDPNNGATVLTRAYRNEFNFRGWRFLSMALSKKYARPRKEWFTMQWYNPDHARLTPPLKLTAIVLTSSQKRERLSELILVRNHQVRLDKIVFFE